MGDVGYRYQRRALAEPDWRRLPAWREVGEASWRDPQWQRAHCVKGVAELARVWGALVPEAFYADLGRDQAEVATMPLLVPPQMLNTIDETAVWTDPVRRYLLPVRSDRHPRWPSHPKASRDSLHESEMWAVEGLTHRYPTKVLAELVATCPQYCGHCTRMDLVGTSTPQVRKLRFAARPADRLEAMLNYLRASPGVRDVVVSGGDVANVPWPRLEAFVGALMDIDSIRDIRLASKAVMGLPQHWLAPTVLEGMARLADRARARGVSLAVHTHVNAAQSLTPLVAEAVRALRDAGVREVRNQGVLLRGVNDSPAALLDLCFALLDEADVTPYYFYLCDMIPGSEHWRLALWEAQELQQAIMGYLPGFATPRLVCDVPFVGKRWVHQAVGYDRERGVSWWEGNCPPAVGAGEGVDRGERGDGRAAYYDPVPSLSPAGQRWWAAQASAA
ncbi:MAG: KamA family radical SAM protein [Mycobacteriales bacterium]